VYRDAVSSKTKHDLDLMGWWTEKVCTFNRSAHPVQSYSFYWFLNCKQQSPSWEANRFSASQEIPRILWTRKFITAFTSASHLSLSWTRAIQSMPPHLTFWKYILILLSHLRLRLPSGSFPQVSSSNPYMRLSSTIRSTCPAILNLLHLLHRIIFGE
jgi:hypothetical protein